jgi:hypothetical protein
LAIYLAMGSAIGAAIFARAGITKVDASIHNPVENWWAVLLTYLFMILPFIFAFRVYRET